MLSQVQERLDWTEERVRSSSVADLLSTMPVLLVSERECGVGDSRRVHFIQRGIAGNVVASVGSEGDVAESVGGGAFVARER